MISVRNINRRYRLNERFIKKITCSIFKLLKNPELEQLNIVFLNDAAIRKLNKKYLHEDRPTDVMSFRMGGFADIFISAETAMKNSEIFNTAFEAEIALYIIHGILHLLGYNDGSNKDSTRMKKRQDEILRLLCKRYDLSKVLTPR